MDNIVGASLHDACTLFYFPDQHYLKKTQLTSIYTRSRSTITENACIIIQCGFKLIYMCISHISDIIIRNLLETSSSRHQISGVRADLTGLHKTYVTIDSCTVLKWLQIFIYLTLCNPYLEIIPIIIMALRPYTFA